MLVVVLVVILQLHQMKFEQCPLSYGYRKKSHNRYDKNTKMDTGTCFYLDKYT